MARGWKIPAASLRRGIAGARWPGRFDVVDRRGPVVLDGAHNADAARALARQRKTRLERASERRLMLLT